MTMTPEDLAALSEGELDALTESIKKARVLKQDAKKNEVPEHEADNLRMAWQFAQKARFIINVPINVEVVVECCDSDPCSIYPSVAGPEYMRDWDAWELVCRTKDDALYELVAKRVNDLKERLDKANKLWTEMRDKYDIDPSVFVEW